MARSARWLRESALPLWATRGFDAGRDAFEEQLDFAGNPVTSVPRRVMVQSRQISVFAAAALSGRYPDGANLALRAARAMCTTYLAADGTPGWVFSVDRDGALVDRRRDLYAHAFVIFALAWALRLERDGVFERAVAATLELVDGAFADPVHGGYWDCLPRADALRRQNPHMHLFEALVVFFETTGREDVLARCRRLRDLAVTRFFDVGTGALREYFGNRWEVHPGPRAGNVEPGHLFEWAWLLCRYQAVSGEDQTASVSALITMAVRDGLDRARGRIVDEIGADGRRCAAFSRAWPHAEALKALMTKAARGDSASLDAVAPILGRLCDVHCRPELGGGWIDQVDAEERPLSKVMPASTLYHIYFGMTAVEDQVIGRPSGSATTRHPGFGQT